MCENAGNDWSIIYGDIKSTTSWFSAAHLKHSKVRKLPKACLPRCCSSSKLVYNDMNLPKNPAFYERDNIALRSKNSWLPTKEWCYTPREIDALLGTSKWPSNLKDFHSSVLFTQDSLLWFDKNFMSKEILPLNATIAIWPTHGFDSRLFHY